VLAFPLEDFHQELDTNEQIQQFVSDKFPEVTFPIFGKSSLKDNVVYQSLKRQMPEHVVKHNFYKYLVNREGIPIKFFTKAQEPLSLRKDIEELLDAPMAHRHVVE
jgi:glutathione peroxidase